MTALRVKLLMLAVLAQALVLSWIYISTLLPVWYGKEVRLQVEGYDPRSLFRGNYARLAYPIVDRDNMEQAAGCADCVRVEPYDQSDDYRLVDSNQRQLRANEILYVMLKNCDSGICGNGGVTTSKPEEGLYLRGRWRGWWRGEIEFPTINAWFTTPEQAVALERELTSDYQEHIAVLRVLPSSGRAAIIRLELGDGTVHGPADP